MYPRIPVSSQSPKSNADLYSFSQLVTYHFRIPLDVTAKTEAPWNSRCAMVKNHPCSKAISSEQSHKFALHQRGWQSPYKWNILEWDKKHQQSINQSYGCFLTNNRKVIGIVFSSGCRFLHPGVDDVHTTLTPDPIGLEARVTLPEDLDPAPVVLLVPVHHCFNFSYLSFTTCQP